MPTFDEGTAGELAEVFKVENVRRHIAAAEDTGL